MIHAAFIYAAMTPADDARIRRGNRIRCHLFAIWAAGQPVPPLLQIIAYYQRAHLNWAHCAFADHPTREHVVFGRGQIEIQRSTWSLAPCL
jgi:hypothetical protein